MAGGGESSKSSNGSRLRKRVEAESSPASSVSPASALKRAKDGSAFAKCEECHKDVPVALISFHNCSLDAKIKMNLETAVVETPTEPKKKSSGEKRKVKSGEPKAKKEKKAKSQNASKRPPTAFFLFMNDFRKSFKEAHPDNKKVSLVAKEGGVKWKSMTDEEKKVYTDKAAELKAGYIKTVEVDGAEIEEDGGDSSEKEVDDENEVEEAKEADDEKDTKADKEVEDANVVEEEKEMEKEVEAEDE